MFSSCFKLLVLRFNRRGVVAFLVIYTCYEIYKEAVLIPLLAWADEEYESLSEKEKAELEKLSEEDPGIFLPCPFTERKIEQPPYKKSDPEWPFLMKARDPKVQKQLSGMSPTRLGSELY